MPSPEQSTSVRAAYLEYSPPLSPCSTSVLTAVDLEDYTPSADLIPSPSRLRIIIIAVSIFALACVTYVIVKTDILSVGSLTPDDYNANIPRDESNNADAAYQMRLHSFCGVTDFKDLCVYDISNSSSTAPSGGSAATSHRRAEVSTKGMVVASIQVAVDGIHRTLNYYRSGKLDSSLKQGIEECNELLGLSLVELDDARSNVLAADVNVLLPMMAADLRDALSAAVTYEQTCAASINSAAMASQAASTAEILSLLGNATISTRNTLAIISSVTEPAEGFYTLPLQPEVDAPSMKPPAEGNLLMEEMGTVEATRGDARIWFPPDINKAPDAVVSKDGSGDCKTVADSLKLAVAGGRERSGRFLIYVKKGVYEETVHVTAEMTRITMYGDGPENTILTGRKRAAGGSTLYGSATFGRDL